MCLAWFVHLPAGLWKNGPIFMTLGGRVAWAKEEAIKLWSRSESCGGYTNYFLLLLTLHDMAISLGGGRLPNSGNGAIQGACERNTRLSLNEV